MQHDTASFTTGDASEIDPHDSPRLSPSTITEHHPYLSLGIQSNQDSYTPLDPPISYLPETQLSGHQSQLSSPCSPSSSVGTPTSSELAAEEQLICPFSQSPLTRSPPAEAQSSHAAPPPPTGPTCITSLDERQRGESSSPAARRPLATPPSWPVDAYTSSECSSPSETDEDMPVSVPPQPTFRQPADSNINSPRRRTLLKGPVGLKSDSKIIAYTRTRKGRWTLIPFSRPI